MNFRLARDQVVILETAANSWAFVGKQNLLFPLGPVIVSGFSLPGASSSYLASKKSVLLRLLLSPRVTSAVVTLECFDGWIIYAKNMIISGPGSIACVADKLNPGVADEINPGIGSLVRLQSRLRVNGLSPISFFFSGRTALPQAICIRIKRLIK